MPNKYLQSQLHVVSYLDVSDDADSESGVFILPHFALFGDFGKNVPFWPLFRLFQTYFAYFFVFQYISTFRTSSRIFFLDYSKIDQTALPFFTRLNFFLNSMPFFYSILFFYGSDLGTWLSASEYYDDNYNAFKDIVKTLNPDDAVSIRDCQEVLKNPLLVSELVFIKTQLNFTNQNFLSLKYGILKLEEQGTDLKSQLEIISTIEDKLPNRKVSEKLKMVLEKNVGYITICQISKIIDGEPSAGFTTELSPSEISAFLYESITSCDVERSFSVYKSILAYNRKTFEFENLRIFCNPV